MAFLKVGNGGPKAKQRLYLLSIELPSGLTVVKIGKASGGSSKARMMQICESIYDKFRVTPKISVKLDREVPEDMVFKWETILHSYFSDYKYETTHKWSGYSESFLIPLDDAKQAFMAVIDGQIPDTKYILPEPSIEDELPF